MALIILMGTFDRDSVDTHRVASALADAMGVSDEEAMAHLEEIYKNPPPVKDPDSKEMDAILFDEHIGGPRQITVSLSAPKDQEVVYGGARGAGKRRVAMMLSATLGMSPEFFESDLDMAVQAVKPTPSIDAKDVIMQLGAYKPEREFPQPDRIPVPKKYSRNKRFNR